MILYLVLLTVSALSWLIGCFSQIWFNRDTNVRLARVEGLIVAICKHLGLVEDK